MLRATAGRVLLVWLAGLLMVLASHPVAQAAHPDAVRVSDTLLRAPKARADARRIPGANLWVSRYNGPRNSIEFANSTGVSPDGTRVFVTGRSAGYGTETDYATVAYNATTGAELWAARYEGPGGDDAVSLAVSPDGTKVFVTGQTFSRVPDYTTIAYSAASGAELWVSHYNGPAFEDDIAFSLAVSPDGTKVFVTGESLGNTGFDYATIAYNAATGAQVWVARYNGPVNNHDAARSIGVSLDGTKVFVSGESVGPGTRMDYATIAYNAATGGQLWVARYNGPANLDDVAQSIGVSRDGTKLFVSGQSTGSGSGLDYATVAYNVATGAPIRLWVARYNGPGNGDDVAEYLGVSNDGGKVFVTGQSTGSGSGLDYATAAYNATSGAQLWVARYNGPANGQDDAFSLGATADGTKVFVTGRSTGSGSGFDYATVAYNSTTGAQLWLTRHNDPANGDDDARSLGVSPDGNIVFVAGTSRDDYATVAHNASTGSGLWLARYNQGNGDDYAYSVGASPDGTKVYVTGASVGPPGDSDYATTAYDAATGAQLWVARYTLGFEGTDLAYSLAVSPDGTKVFVTGWSRGPDDPADYATVAYHAATGAELWVTRYNSQFNGHDFARSIGVSPDGTKVFVTGASDGDYATIAYNAATGAELWVARYHRLNDEGDSLRVSPDGSKVFVTGSSSVSGGGYDYATIAYNAATGVQLWVARYNGPENEDDYGSAIELSPDGTKVFVTGQSSLPSDYATIAYFAATGAELWVARYNGPGNSDDYPFALGVSPDGTKLFVTGQSTGSGSGFDYATMAHDAATGARLWLRRYNGPGNGDDLALSLGVTPDGSKVFVTGWSTGSTSGIDYVTVAYAAAPGIQPQLWVARYNGPGNGDDSAQSLAVSPDGTKVFVTGASLAPGTGLDYATLAYSAS